MTQDTLLPFGDNSSGLPINHIIPPSHDDRSTESLSYGMIQKVRGLRSSYPDTFDYGVYDRIQNRYGKDGIRGGLIFKSPWKLVNSHSSCRKCHYAFEVDTYGRGCLHNCTYCYAKELLTRRAYWNEPVPAPLDISEVRKLFWTIFETDKSHPWREVIERRVPVRMGSMSDSFMWIDKKYKITKEFLKILTYYRYPSVIFTRSDLVADEEYMDVMDPKITSVQFSISGINERLNKLIEPGAPLAMKRLKALKTLSERGFLTAVRINPLFPMYPDGYFSDPEFKKEGAPHLDFFSWDLIDAIAEHKVNTVLAGVVRLAPAALKKFSLAAGIDYSTFFKPELYKEKGDKRFSDQEIGYYYNEIHRRCKQLNLSFTTCYIGNGEKDYFQYQSLWKDKKDCCNIKSILPAFKTTSQQIPLDVRIKHASNTAKACSDFMKDTEGIPTTWNDAPNS